MQALEVSLALLRHAVDDYALRHRAQHGRSTEPDLEHDAAASPSIVPPLDLGSRIVGRLRIIATTLWGRGRPRH